MAKESRVFESIKVAAAVLGVSTDAIKAAKNAGCPAFKQGNRIHEKELLKWLSENKAFMEAPKLGESLKDQKTREEIRKLRIANDAKEKVVVPKQAGAVVIARFGKAICNIIDQKLEKEAPALVTGNVPADRVLFGRIGDSMKSEIYILGVEWDQL